MSSLLGLSVAAGLIVFLVLCWTDFRERIVRPRSGLVYYSAFGLFAFVNLVAFYALLALQLEADPVRLLGFQDHSPVSPFKAVLPLVLAFLYSGAGAKTFKFGQYEVNVYDKMIQLLQKALKASWDLAEDVKRKVDSARPEMEKLQREIDYLRSLADQNNWDKLEAKWKETSLEVESRKAQMDDLQEILGDLSVQPMSRAQIEHVKQHVMERRERLADKTASALKLYLIQFITNNIRDEKQVASILKDIDVEPPPIQETRPNLLARALIISFVAGILLGPAMSLCREGCDRVAYSIIGALSLGAFGGILSCYARFTHWYCRLAMGGVAGLSACAVWYALEWAFGKPVDRPPIYEIGAMGVLYGIATAGVLIIVQEMLGRRRMGPALSYALLGATGFATYFLLALLYPLNGNSEMGLLSSALRVGVIGTVVAVGVGFALDAVTPESWAMDTGSAGAAVHVTSSSRP